MKDLQIDIPSFKRLKDKVKQTNFDFTLLCNFVIYLIVIVIPCFPFTYTYNFTEQLKFSITLSVFLIIFGIIYFLIKNNKDKVKGNKKFKLEIIDYLLIIYMVLILYSALASNYFPDTLFFGAQGRAEGLFTLYLYIFLFYVAYKKFRFNDTWLPHLATSSLIVSCYGIVQAMLPNVFTNHPYCAVSTFGNPNFLSSYLCIFLPIYIIAYLKKGNAFYLITSVVTFSCLVCTKTLGGYITFFMFFAVILIYVFKQKLAKRRLLALVLLFISMFGILNLATNNIYINELFSLKKESNIIQGNEGSLDRLGTGRGLIYKLGIEIILKNPWLGIGPDCLGQKILDEYWGTPVYTSNLLFDKAHSEYLQIAICTGIPSALCYIVFVAVIGITILKKHFKAPQNTVVFALGVSILSYLFQATANISVTQLAPIFWIMLGIGFNVAKSKDTKLNNI